MRQLLDSIAFSVSTQTFILNLHILVEQVSSKGSGSCSIPGLKYGFDLMCWTESTRFLVRASIAAIAGDCQKTLGIGTD